MAPPLSDDQLTLLRRYGQERATTAGQVLFREGDRAYDFIVVVSGAVTVGDHDAEVMRDLATLGPGRFVAELGHLFGPASGCSRPWLRRESGSAPVVPMDQLQEVILQDQQLSDVIVQVMLRRRQWFIEQRAGLQIIGSATSTDARLRSEEVEAERPPHVWVDLDADPAAANCLCGRDWARVMPRSC